MPEAISDYLKKLVAIYKAAGALDFKVSGALTDQQTKAWFTRVFELNAFLNKVSRQLRSEMAGNTGFIEGSNTALTRVAEAGNEDPASTEADVHTTRFSRYLLQDWDVHAFVGYSVLDDNPTHGLLEKINQVIDQSIANSILNLAINGTTDTYADSFLSLGLGWVALAKASGAMNKVLLVADDVRLEDLDLLVMEMLLELPQHHRQDAAVIMSDNERLRRINRLVETTSGDARSIAIAAMSQETKNNIHGKPILTPHFWPDGFFIRSRPNNLEVNMHRTVRRSIKEKERRKGFEYTYLAKGDVEIIHHGEACAAYIPA